MRFGLFLMPEPFPWSSCTLSYDLKLEEIVKAEHLTYDEMWVGEHHTGAHDPVRDAPEHRDRTTARSAPWSRQNESSA